MKPAVRTALLLALVVAACRPLDLGMSGDLAAPTAVDAAPASDAGARDQAVPDLSIARDLSSARDLDEHDLAYPDLAPPPDFNCPGQLSVAPQTLPFGKVTAGQASAPLMVTLANVSGCFVLLRAGRITGPDAPMFGMDQLKYPWWIGPGQTQPVGVWINAPVGSYAATLEFQTDILAQPMFAIPVTATTVNGFPRIGTDVPMIAFGAQMVGVMSNWQSVVITNSGPADLHIAQVSLAGAMPGDFALDTAMLQRTVAMGASTTVRASFRPVAAGPRSAQIVVANDDLANPKVTLPLTGEGQ